MGKTAVVSGANGQDGSYLCELLMSRGYEVYGLVRRSSVNTLDRIKHLLGRTQFKILESDITDPSGVAAIVRDYRPDEIYNLAAMSHVGTSFSQPHTTMTVDALGPLNWLEAIRQVKPDTRFYQASTSEMMGDTTICPQNENTPSKGDSPYAIAKIAAHQFVQLYRKAYGLFACSGILYNHESSRRGENFVTRKITKYVARLAKAMQEGHTLPPLKLGNLDAKRDWGHARDYVEAMWLMLQQDEPDDYVVATGETRSIRDLLDEAFGVLGICWHQHVQVSPEFFRPADVNLLCGDASKAYEKLGWAPKTSFRSLIREMVLNDLVEEGVYVIPKEASRDLEPVPIHDSTVPTHRG